MGRQALTSKESELARSPSKAVKTPFLQGIPIGNLSIPRSSTNGFQKAAQQTPVLGSGSISDPTIFRSDWGNLVLQESVKKWLEITEQVWRCFGLGIFWNWECVGLTNISENML